MHPLVRALSATVGLGAAGLGYASLIERNAFVLRRFTMPILPRGADPIRVVQMSDLHLVPRQERKIQWVRRLADFTPDLVINTGDNLAHMEAVPAVARALEPLYGIPGVFALGSNDYYAPNLKSPTRYLLPDSRITLNEDRRLPVGEFIDSFTREAGWLDLNNARGKLSVGGLDIEFVGVDDPHLDRDEYAAVAGPAAGGSDLFLGVVHAPYVRVLDAMAADGVDAIIAGHTHGGQLCMPWVWRSGHQLRSRPGPREGPESVVGGGERHTLLPQAPGDAPYLHVSAGLGTSPYAPVRFACRPEASLITLVPRA
jgi:predicted MPP superfamily phosphohydrolase